VVDNQGSECVCGCGYVVCHLCISFVCCPCVWWRLVAGQGVVLGPLGVVRGSGGIGGGGVGRQGRDVGEGGWGGLSLRGGGASGEGGGGGVLGRGLSALDSGPCCYNCKQIN